MTYLAASLIVGLASPRGDLLRTTPAAMVGELARSNSAAQSSARATTPSSRPVRAVQVKRRRSILSRTALQRARRKNNSGFLRQKPSFSPSRVYYRLWGTEKSFARPTFFWLIVARSRRIGVSAGAVAVMMTVSPICTPGQPQKNASVPCATGRCRKLRVLPTRSAP